VPVERLEGSVVPFNMVLPSVPFVPLVPGVPCGPAGPVCMENAWLHIPVDFL